MATTSRPAKSWEDGEIHSGRTLVHGRHVDAVNDPNRMEVLAEPLHEAISRTSIEVAEAARVLASCRQRFYEQREQLVEAEAEFGRATAELMNLLGTMKDSVQ